jgi:hypothetical protein
MDADGTKKYEFDRTEPQQTEPDRETADNGSASDIGSLAVRLGLLGFGPVKFVLLGSIRIHMLPVDSTFHVDRFLAALAAGFDFGVSDNLYLSLFPLYHESAHLADGYGGDISTDKRIISNETLQMRMTWAGYGFTVPVRIDIYWHTTVPGYNYNAGAGVQYEAVLKKWKYLALSATGALFGYVVNTGPDHSFNWECSAGLQFRKGPRLLKLGFFGMREYGQGQDYNRLQEGYGVELSFQ